jgi:predicted CxxxxCH...CXXCH cytochrome family protein
MHPSPYVAQHAPAALADLESCKDCHGSDFSGGGSGVSCTSCHGLIGYSDWQTNCTFCHGTRTPGFVVTAGSPSPLVAPPLGTHGETATTQAAVGAHQAHLGNGSVFSDGVACSECHPIPTDLAHVGGATAVVFGALASQGGLAPAYAGGSCSATYCHGATLQGGANTTPSWTGSTSCADCHGLPPSTGLHDSTHHVVLGCGRCHGGDGADALPAALQTSATALALHVNGQNDVAFTVNGTPIAGAWDAVAKTCSNVGCHIYQPTVRAW